MLVILINLVATFGLCLYLSNGQLMLFQPGGIKNVLERLKSTVKEEEKRRRSGDENGSHQGSVSKLHSQRNPSSVSAANQNTLHFCRG